MKLIIHPTFIAALVIGLLLNGSGLCAEGLKKLEFMDDQQLSEQMSRFQDRLNKNGQDFECLKGLGIIYHIKALKDADHNVAMTIEYLSRAREIDQSDMEVLCYLGSATTMLAKKTWNPVKKMKYINKGTGYMDKAVRLAPDNITVRVVRAQNAMKLPAFMDRKKLAKTDLEHVNAMAQHNPDDLALILPKLYRNLAAVYNELGDHERAKYYQGKLSHQEF